MISVKPGGFTVPFRREQPIQIQSRNGNAGNGGRPNTPTIPPQRPGTFPRVNLNPQFQIGAYNNAMESFHHPRFNEYWKHQFNTNNTINPKGWSYTGGLKLGGSGGGNSGSSPYKAGAGYTTKPWDKYDLKQLGVYSGISQSYPYNRNSTSLEGGVQRVWTNGQNVNTGEESQVLPGLIIIDPDGDYSLVGGAVKGSVIGNKVFERNYPHK
jgi:hypothetical protein